MTGLLLALGTGLAAGLHSATWGMYKDAPHEGFKWNTYVRSPILAAAIALAIVAGTEFDPRGPAGLLLLFGVTYGLERAFLEIYKTFLRVEDQSKYTIPMQFAIRGKVVESSALRWLGAALYVGTEMVVLFAVYGLQRSGPALHPLLIVFLVGSAGGWISAIGGAWKDAPVEGFLIFKFFRSPGIAFMYGILLGSLTTNYVFIFIGSIGFTIATIETYKTFFFPHRPRGKFMGKTPLFPEFLETRTRFVPLYVVIWLGVLISGVLALIGPREGVLF